MFILLRKSKSHLLLFFSLSNSKISMIIVLIFTSTCFIVFKITNINNTILFKNTHNNCNFPYPIFQYDIF